MSTEDTKEKDDKAGCTDFESTLKGFQYMCDGMSKCCAGQDGPIDCSAMMERCCGPKSNNTKSDH